MVESTEKVACTGVLLLHKSYVATKGLTCLLFAFPISHAGTTITVTYARIGNAPGTIMS